VRNKHLAWLDAVPADRRVDALCELNVLEQAVNVCQTTVVRDAWGRGQSVSVHGWVYGLHNGLLEDLRLTAERADEVGAAYGNALAAVKRRYDGR
jgi:carbonic anhydrase